MGPEGGDVGHALPTLALQGQAPVEVDPTAALDCRFYPLVDTLTYQQEMARRLVEDREASAFNKLVERCWARYFKNVDEAVGNEVALAMEEAHFEAVKLKDLEMRVTRPHEWLEQMAVRVRDLPDIADEEPKMRLRLEKAEYSEYCELKVDADMSAKSITAAKQNRSATIIQAQWRGRCARDLRRTMVTEKERKQKKLSHKRWVQLVQDLQQADPSLEKRKKGVPFFIRIKVIQATGLPTIPYFQPLMDTAPHKYRVAFTVFPGGHEADTMPQPVSALSCDWDEVLRLDTVHVENHPQKLTLVVHLVEHQTPWIAAGGRVDVALLTPYHPNSVSLPLRASTDVDPCGANLELEIYVAATAVDIPLPPSPVQKIGGNIDDPLAFLQTLQVPAAALPDGEGGGTVGEGEEVEKCTEGGEEGGEGNAVGEGEEGKEGDGEGCGEDGGGVPEGEKKEGEEGGDAGKEEEKEEKEEDVEKGVTKDEPPTESEAPPPTEAPASLPPVAEGGEPVAEEKKAEEGETPSKVEGEPPPQAATEEVKKEGEAVTEPPPTEDTAAAAPVEGESSPPPEGGGGEASPPGADPVVAEGEEKKSQDTPAGDAGGDKPADGGAAPEGTPA